jgi:hypothetical protein
MQYIMAAIGVATLTALLWRVLRPQRPAQRRVRAPDDDPEFLASLNRRQQPGDEG